ncbi:MAG: hypothetical protein ACRERD_05020, partial [Candidatus Binatia bacterium]
SLHDVRDPQAQVTSSLVPGAFYFDCGEAGLQILTREQAALWTSQISTDSRPAEHVVAASSLYGVTPPSALYALSPSTAL